MINTTSDVKSDSFGARAGFRTWLRHSNVALYWPDAITAPDFSRSASRSVLIEGKGEKAVSGHTSGKNLLPAVATSQHKLNYGLMF